MKNNLLVFVMLFLTVACTAQKSAKEYTLAGSCALSSNGDKVYLCRIINGSLDAVDSTLISQDKFEFKGSIDGADLFVLVALKNAQPVSQAVILLENADIFVTMPIGNTNAEVSGSKNYQLYVEFCSKLNFYEQKTQESWAILANTSSTIEQRAMAKDTFDLYKAQKATFVGDFIYKNIPQLVSDVLLKYYYTELTTEDQTRIIAKMKKEMPTAPNYKNIAEELRIEQELAVGKYIKDITLSDMEGKQIKLSDVYSKNKYTLIDFWASWCRPCLMEMPNVIHQYALYHDKGLEIYGISLDNAKNNWQNCVQKYYMTWIQVSDLKGWQSIAAKTYNVKAIPCMYLVNQKGIIVAKNIRGQELANQLETLFK